ncbi:MAG: phosphatidylserine decarboxylase family protein [Acidobacteria bacterium]|nr:MAG: phosphatidylserine decarboxylase family protein [Acidobacteriota bacterium]
MIARDGYPYVMAFVVIAGVSLVIDWRGIAVAALMVAAFMAFFFRDPERLIPEDQQAIVSPADGRVVRIEPLSPTDPSSPVRISIFLSLFDVHINRAPISGQIKDVTYRRGAFKAAFRDVASEVNEQSIVTMEGHGLEITFKQIAGVLARRVVFRKRVGERVAKGERVGLIKFGSRVDVILPPGVQVVATVGEKVYGGTSIIARIPS